MHNKVIVACSQNFNGYGVLRSLHAANIRPDVIVNHSDCPIIECSRFKNRVFFYNNVEEVPDVLLQHYSREERRCIVICCNDDIQSVVNDRFNDLSKYFLLSSINDIQGEITRHMNKAIQMRIASECGIDVPKTWICDNETLIPHDIIYPCIAKVKDSIFNRGIDICNTEDELTSTLKKNPCTVQEYIEKDYEIIIYGTSIGEGEYFLAGVTNKLRQYPRPDGMSSFCVLEDFSAHPNLDRNALLAFLKRLNYRGMFSIEMVARNGKYYLCEINLRNDGKQYFSTVAGANLPQMYINSLMGLPVELPKMKYPTYAMGEFTDIFQVASKQISLFSWLKDVVKTDTFFIINKKDLHPSFLELQTKISQIAKFHSRRLLTKAKR